LSLSTWIFFDNGKYGQVVWPEFGSCRLDLPKLKTIGLNFHLHPVCLDFLLPMKDNLAAAVRMIKLKETVYH
jgi:hypothetical protein